MSLTYTYADYKNNRSPNVSENQVNEVTKNYLLTELMYSLTLSLQRNDVGGQISTGTKSCVDIEEDLLIELVADLKTLGFNNAEYEWDEGSDKCCVSIYL